MSNRNDFIYFRKAKNDEIFKSQYPKVNTHSSLCSILFYVLIVTVVVTLQIYFIVLKYDEESFMAKKGWILVTVPTWIGIVFGNFLLAFKLKQSIWLFVSVCICLSIVMLIIQVDEPNVFPTIVPYLPIFILCLGLLFYRFCMQNPSPKTLAGYQVMAVF